MDSGFPLTKFEHIFDEMSGTSAIGCISDTDPQPLLIRSSMGTYAIATVGIINNSDALIDQYLSFSGGHFDAMTGGKVNSTELVAALISQKSSFAEGIAFAQRVIEGTANILILTEDGKLITARDKLGRIPVQIGKNEDGYCASFEEFAFTKLDYDKVCELGPGEIVKITTDGVEQLAAPGKENRLVVTGKHFLLNRHEVLLDQEVGRKFSAQLKADTGTVLVRISESSGSRIGGFALKTGFKVPISFVLWNILLIVLEILGWNLIKKLRNG